jgi:hypothetical protein
MSKITAVALEAVNGHLYVSTAPGLTGRRNPARVARLTYG